VVERRDEGRSLLLAGPYQRTWLIAGADANGRDLLARMMVAGRVSLLVALLGSAVAASIGVAYGAVAGYAGGRADAAMMRVVDVLYALPFLFLVIMLVVVFGRKFVLIFVAIGAVEWLDMARIVRGQTLSLKNQEFVVAARGLGVAPGSILARHIAPNLAGAVAATLALLAPRVILLESFLSFLGLGVQEPLTSLGVLVADGARHLESAPWMLAFPAALLSTMLLAFNFVSEGLADALDPRER
jgi:oligopeptide transport system permease protein